MDGLPVMSAYPAAMPTALDSCSEQDVGGLRCRHGSEKCRLRCSRIAEHEGDFVGREEVLNELAACPTCHDHLLAEFKRGSTMGGFQGPCHVSANASIPRRPLPA